MHYQARRGWAQRGFLLPLEAAGGYLEIQPGALDFSVKSEQETGTRCFGQEFGKGPRAFPADSGATYLWQPGTARPDTQREWCESSLPGLMSVPKMYA